MSCYNPIYGTVCTDASGKRFTRLGIQSRLQFDEKGVPKRDYVIYPDGTHGYAVQLPCGHCLGCRTDQAKMWSNRLLMESLYHDSVYFVTLTYNDNHVPHASVMDEETGEFVDNLTLSKRDVQLFHKRLRSAFPNDKIRFYIAGEYGDHTDRPHYHAIYFGLHLDDLQPFGMSETGNQYFISPSLSAVWSDPKSKDPLGFVSVEPANEFTFKYVASYVTKKLGVHSNDYYYMQCRQPPFSLSSRRPGIGYQYLMDHKEELLDSERVIIGTKNGSYQFAPPRYFRKKMEEEGVDFTDVARKNRFAGMDHSDNVLSKTDLRQLEYFEVEEKAHGRKIKKRDGI